VRRRDRDMELILISDNKLKVMLSAEDMVRYDMNCDTLECENSPSRRAFWTILEEARKLTGFDPAGARVYVQLYPERDGGCEMFVTKLGQHEKKASVKNRAGREFTASELSEHRENFSGKPAAEAEGMRLYCFSSLADLLSACRRIHASGSAAVSRAYVDETRSRLYLSTDVPIPYIAEYNASPGTEWDHCYIKEHCRCFCRDAARILGELAI